MSSTKSLKYLGGMNRYVSFWKCQFLDSSLSAGLSTSLTFLAFLFFFLKSEKPLFARTVLTFDCFETDLTSVVSASSSSAS